MFAVETSFQALYDRCCLRQQNPITVMANKSVGGHSLVGRGGGSNVESRLFKMQALHSLSFQIFLFDNQMQHQILFKTIL